MCSLAVWMNVLLATCFFLNLIYSLYDWARVCQRLKKEALARDAEEAKREEKKWASNMPLEGSLIIEVFQENEGNPVFLFFIQDSECELFSLDAGDLLKVYDEKGHFLYCQNLPKRVTPFSLDTEDMPQKIWFEKGLDAQLTKKGPQC